MWTSLDDGQTKNDWQILHSFHNDDLTSFKTFDGYPSHLHIDLLPRAQGMSMALTKKMINILPM